MLQYCRINYWNSLKIVKVVQIIIYLIVKQIIGKSENKINI